MTSARPPVLENGSPSEATKRILIFSCAVLVRYRSSGDSASLAQIATRRKSARSGERREIDFFVGTARHGKADGSEGAERADGLEAFSQSFDGGPAAGGLPVRQQSVCGAARADLAFGIRSGGGLRNAWIDFHVQSGKFGA